jgi:hypothetical protein
MKTKPKIKKVSEDLNISKEEKILKNIDDFDITSKKRLFFNSFKNRRRRKEYSGKIKQKNIFSNRIFKKLNAMTVSDVKVSKEFRNYRSRKDALYKIAIKDAFDKGLDFASDTYYQRQLRVYKSLEKEGFDVIYNKNVKTLKNEVC